MLTLGARNARPRRYRHCALLAHAPARVTRRRRMRVMLLQLLTTELMTVLLLRLLLHEQPQPSRLPHQRLPAHQVPATPFRAVGRVPARYWRADE
jgi:hypothetical protein